MFTEIVILCLISCGCIGATKDDHQARFKRDVTDDDTKLTIKSYFINSVVLNHFATVRYTSHVVNEHLQTVKSTFVVPIPKKTFISNFSVIIDGLEYLGNMVLNTDIETGNNTNDTLNARVSYVSSTNHNDSNVFEIDLRLAAGKETTFTLTYYEQLIGTHYKQRILVEPGQVVETLLVNAIFVENQTFETFSYMLPQSSEIYHSSSDLANLLQTPTKRSLLYQLSMEKQLAYSTTGVNGELIIQYDLKATKDAGVIDVQDDYFVHYFTPSGLKPIDKNILFVLDGSGSMSGTKIEQLRESMLTILDNLNPNDNFNILTFATGTKTLFSYPVIASQRNIEKAKSLVNNTLEASGGTAINDALLEAIRSLKALPNKSTRAQLIFFLTDGKATSGETNDTIILQNVITENDGFVSIYCLGFGSNADNMFLKTLATENRGLFASIPENTKAKEQLIKSYMDIKDPLLLDVFISYDSQYVKLNSTSNNKFHQYFDGTEIIVTGRLQKAGFLPAEAVLVQGVSRDGNLSLKMDQKAVVVRQTDTQRKRVVEIHMEALKIPDLLELIEINPQNMDNKNNLLQIAMKYNLVTPFTSYVLNVEETGQGTVSAATTHNCLTISTKACFLFCAFSINFVYV